MVNEQIPLNDQEYRLISQLIYKKSGILLNEKKRALIVGRLNKMLRTNNLKSFKEYYDHVISDSTGKALSDLVDRISTNHTFFYREKDHFEYLSEMVLPEITQIMKSRGKKELRIWCAASSSGEEPYTLAMLLCEYFKNDLASWDTGVLATDISIEILNRAKAGVYSEDNVSQLPASLKNKYFKRLPDGTWSVNNQIKEMVLFRRLNLMRSEFPFKGKFQIMFARNVMIYFDQPTRDGLVQRYYRYMEPGGYLFIGHSETLGRTNHLFSYVKPAVYRKEPIN